MKISRRSVLRYSGLTAALLALTGCSASPGSAILGGDLPDWMKSLFCGSAASSSASSEAAASSAASAGEAAASSAASSEAASSAFSLLPAYDADPLTGEKFSWKKPSYRIGLPGAEVRPAGRLQFCNELL